MSRFYTRVPLDTIHKNYPSGLKITIVKYTAGFSIGVYKGRFKVAHVYRSPYQRKFQNYTTLKPEKLKRQLSEFEDEANRLLESEEVDLMKDYKSKFDELLQAHPEPSYPISAL